MGIVKMMFALMLWAVASVCFALTEEEATHLLLRTGFDAHPKAVSALAPLDRVSAIDQILDTVRTDPETATPSWVHELPVNLKKRKSMSKLERRKMNKERRHRGQQLKAWWFREMLETQSPLTERMTLFWHSHFTSSLRKVKSPYLMYRQNALLRTESMGRFDVLLKSVAKDPAMIVYLDTLTNRKGQPNENFARELLELFTLGEGHYTEKDIKEAARAFTGWSLNRDTGAFVVRQRQHAKGDKTFLGQRGPWTGDDIIRIVLREPRVAEHVAAKLWREFLAVPPQPVAVERIARKFRNDNYSIRTAVREVLLADAFWRPEEYGAKIKSPVELLVGTLRTFNMSMDDALPLVRASRNLGQDILDPPNVKGWPGGNTWVTSSTLMLRQQILDSFVRGRPMAGGKKMMSKSMTSTSGSNGKDAIDAWLRELDDPSEDALVKRLLASRPVYPTNNAEDLNSTVSALIRDPAYQLK